MAMVVYCIPPFYSSSPNISMGFQWGFVEHFDRDNVSDQMSHVTRGLSPRTGGQPML